MLFTVESLKLGNNLQAENGVLVEDYRKELETIVMNGRSTEGEIQKNDGAEYWPQLKWMKGDASTALLSSSPVLNNVEWIPWD